MTTPFESPAALVRHNRRIAGVALALLALGLSAIVLSIATGTIAVMDPALGMGAMGVMALLFAWYENPLPREVEGTVRADPSGLLWNGAPQLARAAITRAFLVPRPNRPPLVKLVRRRLLPPLLLRVSDEAQGRQLLHALGLDPAAIEVELRLPSPIATSSTLRALTAAGAIGLSFLGEPVARAVAPGVRWVLIAFRVWPFLAGTLFVMLSRMIVHLGARSLRVTWLRSERSIPYEQIQSVARSDDQAPATSPWMGLEINLSSGDQIRIPIAPLLGWGGLGVDVVEQRIREAMRAYARSERPADP